MKYYRCLVGKCNVGNKRANGREMSERSSSNVHWLINAFTNNLKLEYSGGTSLWRAPWMWIGTESGTGSCPNSPPQRPLKIKCLYQLHERNYNRNKPESYSSQPIITIQTLSRHCKISFFKHVSMDLPNSFIELENALIPCLHSCSLCLPQCLAHRELLWNRHESRNRHESWSGGLKWNMSPRHLHYRRWSEGPHRT